jgi:sulfonate transport system permease protein
LLEVAKVYRLTYLQSIFQIVLPAASPGILVGLRNSLSLAWMFMIAAELIAATQGIGYLLSDGRETSRPDIVIIAIIFFMQPHSFVKFLFIFQFILSCFSACINVW